MPRLAQQGVAPLIFFLKIRLPPSEKLIGHLAGY